MAALAADVNGSLVGNFRTAQVVADAADTYYRGSCVTADQTSGNAKATAASGEGFLGISPKKQVVAAGDLIEVIVTGEVWLPLGAGPVTAANVNDVLCRTGATNTDNPADLVASATPTAADAALGRIKRVTSTQNLVELGPGITGAVWSATLGWV